IRKRAHACASRDGFLLDLTIAPRKCDNGGRTQGHFGPKTPLSPVAPRSRAVSDATDSAPLPFTIPPGSPLATGWRFQAVLLLERHGVQDMIDTIAAYAGLRCRLEPDDCSAAEESAQGSWIKPKPGWNQRRRTPWHLIQEPVQRRL